MARISQSDNMVSEYTATTEEPVPVLALLGDPLALIYPTEFKLIWNTARSGTVTKVSI